MSTMGRSTCVALVTVLCLGGTTSFASAAPGSNSVTLSAEAQARPNRPDLDAIKREAARGGSSLEQAVDRFVSRRAGMRPPAALNQPDGPVDVPDVMIDDIHAAELEDLKRIAAAERIGLDDAIDKFAWQDEFQEVAARFEKEFPDVFAGAVKNDDSAWFGFKGLVPPAAVDAAKRLPVRVDLVGGRPLSETELRAESRNAHRAVMAEPEVLDASTSYDVRTAEVRVDVRLRGTGARSGAPVADRLTVPASKRKARLKITETGEGMRLEESPYIRGGGLLGGCTSGFNIKATDGRFIRHGTAGHCVNGADVARYENHPVHGGSTTVAKVWWTEKGAIGDIGYYDVGSKTPTRTFYYDWNAERYVDVMAGMPAVGTTICHFGRTTGASCAKVAERYAMIGEMTNLVIMDRNASAPGDSGGPWYYGGTAYGIHNGKIGDRSFFTAAYQFQHRGYVVYTRSTP